MKKKRLILPITVSLFIILIGTAATFWLNEYWSNKPISLKSTLASQITEQKTTKDLSAIIHEAQKNVVQIEANTDWSEKIGSGFLYNDKGDIITNAHVIKDATSIYVKTANAQTYTAALVGIGEKKDIAVIRVPQLAKKAPAILDEQYQADIGDEIIAVGSPLGFQNSVTLGIISGMNRSFSIDDYDYDNVYQISAHITHGNSGGPLINRTSGKVIAVNSAGTEEGSLGFSIPINTVIEDVRKWSEQAENKQLTYDSLAQYSQIDPQELQEDAEYIIKYFFDSLAMRDYINAYTLLGSEWQTKTNYQDFREDYIHVDRAIINSIESDYLDDENVIKLTLVTDIFVRESIEKVIKETYNYVFTIGYENDLLKVLDGKRDLINSVETETSDT